MNKVTPYQNTIGYPLEVKRLYVPFLVSSACPECGAMRDVDLTHDHPLTYPKVGVPTPIYLCCETCTFEWTVKVILNLRLSIV